MKQFVKDLWHEVENDNVSNGAAALAYFWMLAIFPAAIALLSVLPYLPIPNLQQAIMGILGQAMPGQAASLFSSTVEGVVNNRSSGLLSVGFIGTLWAGASGIYSVMQQLNITYDVKEQRPFWKARGTAVFLLFLFGALIVTAFSLVVFGGDLQDLATAHLGEHGWLLAGFAVFRWAIILGLLLLGFAVIYYFGPDVQQAFKFITPGSVAGTVILILAALGFRFYVDHFGSYNATYGSLGAVIILLFWLYITGMVLLLGSEVNALYEHYRADGKSKGEKELPS
jgi:membrane protein